MARPFHAIQKRGRKWVVVARSTGRVLGEHDTRGGALRQLRAVEYFTHRNPPDDTEGYGFAFNAARVYAKVDLAAPLADFPSEARREQEIQDAVEQAYSDDLSNAAWVERALEILGYEDEDEDDDEDDDDDDDDDEDD